MSEQNDCNKKIKYLVADTTAFINAVQLNEYAENVFTVPDVMTEVKNKRQIRRLCVLPFDLKVREPRTESVRHCVEFAKKTGDYASLSGIDMKVISLTYELEAEHVGTMHLRTEPTMSKVVASKDKPVEFKDKTNLAGWYNPKGNSDESDNYVESEDDDVEDDDDDESGSEGNNTEKKFDPVKDKIEKQLAGDDTLITSECQKSESNEDDDNNDISQEALDTLFEKLKCTPSAEDVSNSILIPEKKQDSDEETDDSSADDEILEETSANHSNDDLDDGGWITPSNVNKAKKSLEGKIEYDIKPEVACITTDYALQNVLKQMNLNISALDGRIIKEMRTYILRCYGCYKTTSIMTKVFCPNCGNKTLKRVAVSLDEYGKQVIHINTRRPLTAKYKNQSLPRFRGGKHSRNPILFEDQPIPRQMPSRVAKTKTNAMDENYIAGFSPFVMRDIDSKSAMLRSKGNLKEWARNNTFEEDRRKKRYNRLYK